MGFQFGERGLIHYTLLYKIKNDGHTTIISLS